MIKREKYINEIKPFYNSDLVKIITGVRRSGKSVILQQIMEDIRNSTENIVYLNFDDRFETKEIKTWEDIVSYVKKNRKQGLCYVFLDEVQEIEGWATACRSLRLENCSVFVTGSNSKLLAKEFTAALSGRYVSFRVRPFVYSELQEYAKQLGKTVSVTDYLVWGGFPKRLEFNTEIELKRYLLDLDRTIVTNDIVNRYKIRKSVLFEKFADYILISNSRIYSTNSIKNYLKSCGEDVSINTVQKWINYLSNAYVIDEITKYSLKAKTRLEQSRKLYLCDVALNSIRCTNNRYDLTHNLKNIVYNELCFRGFNLSIFNEKGREIDFLAQKDGKKYYIQVAYSLTDEKAYQREFSAFNSLTQIDKKIIISNDDIDYSTSNIQHIKLSDFLNNTAYKNESI